MKNIGKAYFSLIMVFIIILCSVINSKCDTNEQKNILILNAYHQSFSWTDDQVEGIIESLSNSELKVDISIEYLDWKRYPTDENLKKQFETLKYKYQNNKIDLIITTDDIALQFAIDNRKEIFSDAPIVFSGVQKISAQKRTTGVTNITGVYEELDPWGTVLAISKIHKDIQNIYIITENTESGSDTAINIEKAIIESNSNVSIINISNLPFEDILKILKEPQEKSVAIMASYATDAKGVTKSVEFYTSEAGKVSDIPIYGVHDNTLGYGIVGGSLLSGQLQGKEAGSLAVRALSGTPIDSIQISDKKTVSQAFDYFYLQKYNISTFQLPKGSTIINRPFSIINEYPVYFIGGIVIIALLIAFIVFLMVFFQRERKMKKELSEQHKELSNLYEELTLSEEELRAQNEELIISHRKLEASETRYRLVAESANDIVWEWDIKTDERIMAKKAYEMLGYKYESINTMKKWYDILHPEDVNLVKEEMRKYLDGETQKYNCEYRVIKADNSIIWVVSNGKATIENEGHFSRME